MNRCNKMLLTIPLILFIAVITILWSGLHLQPNEVPSPLVNKSVPQFSLPTLTAKRMLTSEDFIGHITLLNIWATWCKACAEEHQFLLSLAKNEYLTLYGLDYKDNTDTAQKWLKENGNPFQLVGLDLKGKVAIDWGVYGTPETFLIDKKGVIRYKQVGPITPQIWDKNFRPIIEKIRLE